MASIRLDFIVIFDALSKNCRGESNGAKLPARWTTTI